MAPARKGIKALSTSRLGGDLVPIIGQQMLQYLNPGKSGECELVVGLDFGTSSSKVAIQAPDLPGSPAFAVDFRRLFGGNIPYLLPTRLWVTPSNGLCTLWTREGAIMVNNIKLELFSKDVNLGSSFGPFEQQLPLQETAVCYLALLLRFSRRWFLKTRKDLVKHFKRLRWSVNMGVPSPCIEDNEENQIFRRVGKAAWWLSTISEDYITLDRASRELESADDTDYWDNDEDFACDFEIIPEIAAGAVGYALSDLRREGLHVMVDIGASTVDVCSFLLHEREGCDRYSLLISDVQQLGSVRLATDRVVAFRQMCEERARGLLDKYDPMLPVEMDVRPYIVTQDQLNAVFESAMAQLREQFLRMVRRVIWQTKLRKNPDARLWREGQLPILLIGGGSKLQFFRSAFDELNDWLKYNTRNDGIKLQTVPVPEPLADLLGDAGGYHYFAVTWGLSHRALDIGEIVPADRITDVVPPPSVDWRKRYVGKELV